MFCSIYRIVNRLNGKVYVGQTWRPLGTRLRSHRSASNCVRLYRAIKKYGWANFKVELLTVVHTQGVADYWEQHFIKKFDAIQNGYNIREGGSKGRLSASTKAKISEKALERWKIRKPTGQRVKLPRVRPENNGVKHLEAVRRLVQTPEWIRAQREGIRKKVADPKWRAAVKEGAARRSSTPQWKQNHAEGMRQRRDNSKWKEAHLQTLGELNQRASARALERDAQCSPKERDRRVKKREYARSLRASRRELKS